MEDKTYSFTSVHKKVFLVAVVLCLLASLLFSVFFLIADYRSLSEWYLNMGSCFYKQEEWSTLFFTQHIKSKGNVFAGLSTLVATAGIFYIGAKWNVYTIGTNTFVVKITRNAVYWYVAVFALSIYFGVTEWRLLSPAYDEVFSAINCAELPLFKTLSYYMLPNNHIGFNAINKVLFGWYGDFVESGRLISLLAYTGVMAGIFYTLSLAVKNRVMAFVALVPVTLQFHTWGFAAQARGYELLLLCGWVAILSVWGYVRDKKSVYLLTGTTANILGFIILPSFMYLYPAQLACVAAYMLYNRKWDAQYIKYQLVLVAVVYLWYTPALCFSGLEAFTDNKWVKPMVHSVWEYIPMFWLSFTRFINDCFYGNVDAYTPIWYIVFITPVLLLFSKDKKNKQVSIFYIALWVSYILYSLVIRRTPFHRTLIIHFSVTMACCVYAYYVFISFVIDYISSDKLKVIAKTIVFSIPVFLYAGYRFQWNINNVSWVLYGYDINSTYNNQTEGLMQISDGSTVSFSDEAFYFYYIARKINYSVNRCGTTDASYYIKSEPEVLPALDKGAYKFVAGCGDNYAIYKRE